MLKPNYKNGSTLSLISSIGEAFSYRINYKPLKLLKPNELKNSKNIVLMIIDGLGYEFLKKYGKGTEFNKNLKGKMTTVFPSSTSAAMTSFYTGLSPQEHGMTGWHMFMKEFGDVIIPLPYITRFNKNKIMELVNIKNLFILPSFLEKLKVKTFLVQHKDIIDTHFTRTIAGKKTTRTPYNNLPDYFNKIRRIIKSSNRKKFIFAYYGEHDSLAHKYGTESRKVQSHFKELNKKFSAFLDSIKNINATIIVTADHGHIDIEKEKRIHVKDHPILEECLALPLCGEERFTYAYIKPSKEKQFVSYMKKRLKYCCEIYKSKTLLQKGYFGKGKIHKNFTNRIGDYVILMKDNYGIYDWPIYIKKHRHHIGDHGGLSKEELFVPLFFVKSQ